MDENRNVMIGESLHEAGEGVRYAFNQDGQLFSDKLFGKSRSLLFSNASQLFSAYLFVCFSDLAR